MSQLDHALIIAKMNYEKELKYEKKIHRINLVYISIIMILIGILIGFNIEGFIKL